MIENLINELAKANTKDEILSYKSQISKLYNELYEKICFQNSCVYIQNYRDIKMLHELRMPMMAYSDSFYDKFAIPFLKEHNSETIDILEFVVLFYILQVINLLENGFFNKASKWIYKNSKFDHTEKINLTDNTKNLFCLLWCYFMEVINIKDDTRQFTIAYDEDFYLNDEKYEEVIDAIYESLKCDSRYFLVIGKILGQYRLRFTKMKYIIKYQPLFVNVGYEYFWTLIQQNQNVPEDTETLR